MSRKKEILLRQPQRKPVKNTFVYVFKIAFCDLGMSGNSKCAKKSSRGSPGIVILLIRPPCPVMY